MVNFSDKTSILDLSEGFENELDGRRVELDRKPVDKPASMLVELAFASFAALSHLADIPGGAAKVPNTIPKVLIPAGLADQTMEHLGHIADPVRVPLVGLRMSAVDARDQRRVRSKHTIPAACWPAAVVSVKIVESRLFHPRIATTRNRTVKVRLPDASLTAQATDPLAVNLCPGAIPDTAKARLRSSV